MTPHFMSGPGVQVAHVHELLEAALAQTDEVQVLVEERHAAWTMADATLGPEWDALQRAHALHGALIAYQVGLYDFLHSHLQAEVRALNAGLAEQLEAWRIPCHA